MAKTASIMSRHGGSVAHRMYVALVVVIAAHSGAGRADSVAESASALEVRRSHATGVARFVAAVGDDAITVPIASGRRHPQPLDFFRAYGRLFGVSDPARQLTLNKVETDVLGHTHTTFQQVHKGVSVFAGILRVHFNARGELIVVNGTFIPDINLDVTPVVSAELAAVIAVQEVNGQQGKEIEVSALNKTLYVFRIDLAKGVPGSNHLVYEIEVGNGRNVREFVYVDAHTGDVVDQITGIYHALDRRIYDEVFDPAFIVWSEGDSLPFGDVSVDDLIDYAEDAYNLYSSMSAGMFLSWDGVDGTMHSVNDDVTIGCPNAHWTGAFTGYCIGITGDDTVGHEWAHAYTQSTHSLIYRWQPGALNESYSDIFGEVVDLLNGSGTDSPAPIRTVGDCSIFGGGPPPPLCEINSPPRIAAVYPAGGAAFNPPPPVTVTADVQLVKNPDGPDDNGRPTGTTNGCQPLIRFTAGNIALIDRGGCSFVKKVQTAVAAGAVGVIIVNNDGDGVFTMTGDGPLPIPCVMIGQGNGSLIKSELNSGLVNATIAYTTSTAPSLRWLHGEDDSGFGGPIRDMWNPNCFGDPAKVSDTGQYFCNTWDNGGVHTNSGVPNHAFALLVDGGTFNGQTVAGIGLTKAAHIYWRAQAIYQVPSTDFSDHADALEQSCIDLTGAALTEVSTDNPTPVISGEMITPADCGELAKAILAAELRSEPVFCGFSTLLDPNAPPLCGGSGDAVSIFLEDWEAGLGSWTVGTRAVADPFTFDTPDWAVVDGLPDDRAGSAAFVIDDAALGDCSLDTEAGVLFLESPAITIPPGADLSRIAFDHWVATERLWDGGNVKISINGGPYTLIPGTAFDFNTYPYTLNASPPNDNPMAGEAAFTGMDDGVVTGSWVQSHARAFSVIV